jgi:hypothetical protein
VGKFLFGKDYVGTYSSDNIPILKKDQMCIINNKPLSSPGEHWVALAFINSTKKIMVYDSFGRKTTSLIPSLIQSHIDTDPDAEQSIDEENCGARCMAWLLVFKRFGAIVAKKI